MNKQERIGRRELLKYAGVGLGLIGAYAFVDNLSQDENTFKKGQFIDEELLNDPNYIATIVNKAQRYPSLDYSQVLNGTLDTEAFMRRIRKNFNNMGLTEIQLSETAENGISSGVTLELFLKEQTNLGQSFRSQSTPKPVYMIAYDNVFLEGNHRVGKHVVSQPRGFGIITGQFGQDLSRPLSNLKVFFQHSITDLPNGTNLAFILNKDLLSTNPDRPRILPITVKMPINMLEPNQKRASGSWQANISA